MIHFDLLNIKCRLFVYYLCVYISCCLCSSSFDKGTKNEPPNIIMIVADDLGWMDVGFHGSNDVQTPNIDALAYHGMSLYQHYTLPTCSPSRAALLTGKHQIRLGIHSPFSAGHVDGIPLNETLLPQYLKQLGYKTHLIGKWHVGYSSEAYLPNRRGFDSHFGYYTGYIGYYDGLHIPSHPNVAGLDVRRNGKPAWTELSGKYATTVFTNEAIKIIQAHDKKSPLFLEVAQLAPHSGNTNARLQVSDIDENDKQFGYIKDQNRRLYAGMVKELDDSVGNIIAALEKNDLLKNSIIVFMSDNGAASHDPFWHTTNYGSNWPMRGEKGSLHEGGIRTAAAIWSPYLLKPFSVYKNLFHVVDWLPTLLAAAGGNLHQLENTDGVNQWDDIINNYSEKKNNSDKSDENQRTLLLEISENEAIRSGKWKIIKNNPHSSLSFTNYYYGDSGTGEGIPDYNVTAIMTSTTAKILSSVSKLNKFKWQEDNSTFNNSDVFLKLREENRIDCKKYDNVKNFSDCYYDYCLFNLEDDPCEKNNLINEEKTKFNELLTSLNNYRKFIVIPEPSVFYWESDPKYWNNYWSPWINEKEENSSANSKVVSSSYFCSLLFLSFCYAIIFS